MSQLLARLGWPQARAAAASGCCLNLIAVAGVLVVDLKHFLLRLRRLRRQRGGKLLLELGIIKQIPDLNTIVDTRFIK